MATEKEHQNYTPLEPQSVTARRYRTSKYFLKDQLRCSEAVHDFRSVKAMVSSLPQFSLRSRFQFAAQAVEIRE